MGRAATEGQDWGTRATGAEYICLQVGGSIDYIREVRLASVKRVSAEPGGPFRTGLHRCGGGSLLAVSKGDDERRSQGC